LLAGAEGVWTSLGGQDEQHEAKRKYAKYRCRATILQLQCVKARTEGM